VNIAGATNQAYLLTANDVGHTIRVQESATNAGGTGGPATSTQTGVVQPQNGPPTAPSNNSPPVITGVTRVGHTLTTSVGDWSGTAPIVFTYEWQRCTLACRGIPGATQRSYVLTSNDRNAKVRVLVTATNSVGKATAISSEVGPIASDGARSARIRALLSKALPPRGTIGRVLSRGYFALAFSAPSSGLLVLSAQSVSTGSHHGSPFLVARIVVRFHKAGAAKIKMVLTPKGRRLLAGRTSLNLTAKGTFTPRASGTASVTKTFKVRR
jgi:hypothetical protein